MLLGVGIFVWFTLHGREPQKKTPTELARPLRVVVAQPVNVVPRVLGYGTAKPAQVRRALPEVEGRVIEVHTELKAGAFIKVGARGIGEYEERLDRTPRVH